MNKAILKGNLTRDPEIRFATSNGKELTIANFGIAVNDDAGNVQFINITAFDKRAEFVQKHFSKGSPILITGRIVTDSYTDKDQIKRYATKVIAEHVEFCERKTTVGTAGATEPLTDKDGYMNIPDGVEDAGLPFE